ncbi:MAG TPA: alpha-glucosidase/alpha-galactosidase [Rubrobacteraceae bacterium]|nr:alpha-glucosidase/alpha-galactosidase [Rubrobacteraceae bacterium]
MVKIAFMGAGSVEFTKNLLTDTFAFDELRGATVALHDIDAERLETAGMMARWTSDQLEAGARVEEHLDRRGALDGADFVINMVQIGMHEATLVDFEIPKKYGLKQTIADSMGIGGIFRGLRTIPFVFDLAHDMRELCPGALLMNYTNPMGVLMEALYTAHPEIRSVGLCHSVPYTVREIAAYIGVPHEKIVFECAGINHIAWMTRLEVGGEDAYPRLFEAMEDPEIYARDRVRFELMRRFGYFVTESSEHNAEYTPYFLRDDALIERFDIPVDDYVRRSERNLRRYADVRKTLLTGGSFPLDRSVEYGSLIIHSTTTGLSRTVYGNVENTALIANLPHGSCVEVPVLVDAAGLRPCHAGDLPPQLAATCAPHTAVQNLTVRAALEAKREHVYHAAMLDRHASSVLSLDDIAALVDELMVAHGDSLPEGLRASGEETR